MDAPKEFYFIIFCYTFQVRTRDNSFESVTDLVNYHTSRRVPIFSGGSTVDLLTPVDRF